MRHQKKSRTAVIGGTLMGLLLSSSVGRTAGRVDMRPVNYDLQPAGTSVEFRVGRAASSAIGGTFSRMLGTMVLAPDDPALSNVMWVVPISSLSDAYGGQAASILSATWLDAAEYSEANFMSTSIRTLSTDAFEIRGNLTLRGVTRSETFEARIRARGAVTGSESKIVLESVGVIRRSDFGMHALPTVVEDRVRVMLRATFVGSPMG